eukprot:scaffold273312_cov21-Tisochrysis_lutea.AAC.1
MVERATPLAIEMVTATARLANLGDACVFLFRVGINMGGCVNECTCTVGVQNRASKEEMGEKCALCVKFRAMLSSWLFPS